MRPHQATARLDEILVAPGRVILHGVHYPYAECTVTIEESEAGGHIVVVADRADPVAPSRWQRFTGWLLP